MATSSSSNSNRNDGFDLDAIPSSHGDEVIYELGGGATVSVTLPQDQGSSTTNGSQGEEKDEDPLAASEEYKKKGNGCFKDGNYLDAMDYYTDAIEACPGMKGEEVLALKDKHEQQEREKANQRYQRDTDRRMKRSQKKLDEKRTPRDESQNTDGNDSSEDEDDSDLAPSEFIPPTHEYGKNLAVYYSNRAACLIHLQQYDEAIASCDIAIFVQPTYVKSYIRRMTCHNKTEQTDLALRDAKKALELSPNNAEIKRHVKRLEKEEAERMEKLKEETMGKLKDLGNSILGNFGMSLDNFKAEKDPNTGAFSIKMV